MDVSILKKSLDLFFSSLIALFMISAGGVGTYLLGGFLTEVIEVKSWEEVACRVNDLWLEDAPYEGPHIAGEFSYRWEGTLYTSNNISLTKISYVDPPTDKPNVDNFNAGSVHLCLVNPDHPEEALLRRPFWLAVWTAWPGIFMTLAMFVAGILMLRNIVLNKPVPA